MICSNCGKNNATTTVKQTINGQTSIMYLCSDCASKLHTGWISNPFFNTSSLFSGLFNQQEFTKRQQEACCPHCGATLRQILSTGHLGCSGCVQAFKQDLLPIIRKIHGNAAHTGKVPQSAPVELKNKRQIEMLEQKLSSAVQSQQFEEAATLRDQIKQLKGEAD